MAEIIPLHVCGSCGSPNCDPPRVLVCEGEPDTTVFFCEACLARHEATLAKVRPVFGTMIDIGVPREIASDVMTYLLERWPDP